MLIAYLEDDADQATVVASWLLDAGHQVEIFGFGRQFIKDFPNQQFEVALLDWELPDSDGLQILSWIRKNQSRKLPVIFLTARDHEDDVVAALQAGADDYLVKPLSPALTMARLQAVTRRVDGSKASRIRGSIGPFHYDKRLERLQLNGKEIALTRKEFLLAMMLFQNLGRVVSRDAVLLEVWGLNESVLTRTVDTHISRLRKKLGLTPEHGWELKSLYHQGYRLEQIEQM